MKFGKTESGFATVVPAFTQDMMPALLQKFIARRLVDKIKADNLSRDSAAK